MKHTLAFLLAAALGVLATPALGQDLRPLEPSVLYYVSIPLGAQSRAEREPVIGFALQGARPYQAVRMDSRIMNFAGTGVFEVKWLIVGAVAAGAAVVAGGKDKSVEIQQAQQAQAVEQTSGSGGPTPCQVQPACFAMRR